MREGVVTDQKGVCHPVAFVDAKTGVVGWIDRSLRQRTQNFTIVMHDVLGKRHLQCEFRIVRGQAIAATCCLGEIEQISFLDLQVRHDLFGEDYPRRSPNCGYFERMNADLRLI